MLEVATAKSHKVLFLNTLAFTVCFAVWMFNGVLVTFLADNQVFDWGPIEIGWLMGIPVLTGSIFRLPAGMLTDKFGGKPIYGTKIQNGLHDIEPDGSFVECNSSMRDYTGNVSSVFIREGSKVDLL